MMLSSARSWTAWRRFVVIAAVLFSSSLFAGPKKVEVVVAIPDGAKIDGDLRTAVQLLADEISRKLHTFEDVSVPLPASILPEGAEFVGGETPLSISAERDVFESAHGADNTRLRLSPEQWRSIRKKGYYFVPSKNFPGQMHKWELWLLEGSEAIQIFVRSADAVSTRVIRIGIPAMIRGNTLSIRQGFVEFGKGLRGFVKHVVGFVETYPKHRPDQVASLIADDVMKYMEGLAAASTGEKYDLRAFNPALVAKVQSALQKIESEVEASHQKAVLEAQRIEDQEARAAKLAELAREYDAQTTFFESIATSPDVERVSPGLGPVLARYGRALQRLRAHEQNFAALVDDVAQDENERLVREEPSLSEDKEWLAERVREASTAFYREHWPRAYEAALADLREAGFAAEAWALERTLEYLRHDGWEQARTLAKERLPLRRIRYDFWAFDSGKWKKRQLENGAWVAEPTSTAEVTSTWPAWKLGRLWYTTGWSAQSGLRTVLVDWLWNGPVGVQSLFKKDPFPGRYQIDSKTGELVAPPKGYNATLWSNLKALYASIAADREAYDRAPDSGMFGKFPKRVWQFFWSDLAKGVVAPIFVIGGRVLATGTTALVGAGVTVTTPVWAPLAGTLEYGWTTIVVDNYPVRDLPNYQGGLGTEPGLIADVFRITVTGAGQAALATVGVAAAPFAAAGVSVGARVVGAVRHLWSGLMYYGFRALGAVFGAKVPTDNSSYFVYHTEGPGVGGNLFVTIDDQAVVLAALLQLEIAVLEAYRHQVAAWQAEPLANAQAVLSSIPWDAFGLEKVRISIDEALAKRLALPMAASVKAMEEAIKARQDRLAPLLTALQTIKQNHGYNALRLSQEQIDRLLPEIAKANSQLLAGDRLFPAAQAEVRQRFWDKQTNSVANDHTTLARKLVTDTLGHEALTPPSLDAGRFQTSFQHPSVGSMLGQLLSGNALDLSIGQGVTPVGPIVPANPDDQPPPVTPAPAGPRTTVRVSAGQICANEVARLAEWGIIEGNLARP